MKKIDLHIHTRPAESERQFEFCIDTLNAYISTSGLDCIAITNHNLFDLEQFNTIVAATSIPVLPGIEIDLEKAQILLISDGIDLVGFDKSCQELSETCSGKGDSVTVEELNDIFGNLSDYLLIPHYDKDPAINQETLNKLGSNVKAGEVTSPKKFIYSIKEKSRLVPVLFSDCRIDKNLSPFPVRHTFLDCDTISFKAIQACLSDKNKVGLSKSDGHSLFQVFADGQQLSTGLNVILGERSSGKSHTLRRIHDCFDSDSICYLPQFALVARTEEEDDKRFKEQLNKKESLFSDEHLKQLKTIVEDVIGIDLEADERSISRYLDTLLRYAKETERHDAFSKATLFGEEKYPSTDLKGLKELIDSTKNLLSNIEFRSVIDKHIPFKNIRALYVELIELCVIIHLWTYASLI